MRREKHQAFRHAGNTGEMILVRGGKRAYLWFQGTENYGGQGRLGVLSGPATLRKLALAILKEVGRK